MWKQKICIAKQYEVLDSTTLVMVMEADTEKIRNDSDFEQAVISASTEYCLTEEGRKVYEGNFNSFNWGDFSIYVPNAICEKYGIRKTDQADATCCFEFDQQLVKENE